MFGLFGKSPEKKLQAEFDILTKKAFEAQRNGNIRGYSELTAEAEAVRLKMEALKTGAPEPE